MIGMTRSDTIVSGSFKHITQIGNRFREEGAEVVYILGGDGVSIDKIKSEGFKVYQLQKLHRNLHLFSDVLSLLTMIFLIIKERPDLCSWHTAKIGAIGRIASMFTFRTSFYVPHGVPFVNTPENLGYEKYQFIEKILSVLPSKIIGVCEFDRNEYLRIGVPYKKLLVIPNGMEGIQEAEVDLSDDNVVKFITAARFEKQKDYYTLSMSCKKLYKEGFIFKLEIYGDGFMEEEVKAMFSELPTGCVIFNDVVDDFALKLSKAHVFILSSFWEGLPRSIIEAMACKKPIIASDVGGNSELVFDGVNGYLVPISDINIMYEAMKKYIKSPILLSEHGNESYSHYVSNYTLESMLIKYCDAYGII